MEWQIGVDADSGSLLPQVVEPNPNSPQKSPKDRLVKLLDQVEMHVERLRKDAFKLEEQRDTLLTTMDTIRNSEMMLELSDGEREDVLHYADHITNRSLTVDIHVKTARTDMQEDALHQVNRFIDSLVMSLQNDPFGTKSRCVAFMNACSSHTLGTADKNFETAILGCTLDDQKRVKRRLQGLLDYMDKAAHFG